MLSQQKSTTALVTLLVILSMGLNAQFADASDTKLADHIGSISPHELLKNYPKFATNYAEFAPSKNETNLIQILNNKEVIVLFGTWCHDSVREVPRLLKLLEVGQVSPKKLTLYGINRRKSDPERFAAMHNLKYTPTIIIKNDQQEIARIIERPKTRLADDLALQINQAKHKKAQ